MKIICPQCGNDVDKAIGEVNRAAKAGLSLYCGRVCAGIARRNPNKLTGDAFKAAKSEYDKARRAKIGEKIRAAKKAAYRLRVETDLEKLRLEQKDFRKKRMPKHVEYCRRPEYKKWKAEYDKRYLAQKAYGEFAEAAMILRDVESEVLSRASRYQLDLDAGKLCKSTRRKREYAKAIGC